jgi:hypothetical protein
MRNPLARLRREINQLRHLVRRLNREGHLHMADTTALTAAVAALGTAATGVEAYVATLKSADDQAAIDAA